jgi:hypothetical protein
MAVRIIPRIFQGRVFYQLADVLFPTFDQAGSVWFAAVTPRLDTVDDRGAQ